MIITIMKDEYDKKTPEERKNWFINLKKIYGKATPPTEVLLGKIEEHLSDMHFILKFYFICTIIGIIILFFSVLGR